ncbi:MAG: hypothetical protein AB7T32_05990 [Dehalococcoidia bacterium]
MSAQMLDASQLDETPMAQQIRLLLQVALLLFIVTVAIGILNGTDLVDFSHQELMTHVHAGTLGWITLATMAGSLWLFGAGSFPQSQQDVGRLLATLAMIFVPLYVLAFFTTTGYLRPAAGAATMLVFFVFFAWVGGRIRHVELSVPHLGILAAVASSAVGAVLGVLLGLQIASGEKIFPTGGEDSHPAMMVVGFLVPVGMALSEWGLRYGKPALPLTTAGKFQIGLPFVGGLLVMIGLLLDATPLIGLSLPFEIIGIVIYLRRLWPDLRSIDWINGAQERFSAFSAIALPLDIAWITYIIVRFEGDVDLAPIGYILALDHLMFIGVVTNSVFALMSLASARRRDVLPWADSVFLFLTSIPLAIFWVGLVADSSILKQIATPVMGTSILLAILTFSVRLQLSRTEPPVTASVP